MIIALLAILGALTKAGAGFWICYGFYCLGQLIKLIVAAAKQDNKWGG